MSHVLLLQSQFRSGNGCPPAKTNKNARINFPRSIAGNTYANRGANFPSLPERDAFRYVPF